MEHHQPDGPIAAEASRHEAGRVEKLRQVIPHDVNPVRENFVRYGWTLDLGRSPGGDTPGSRRPGRRSRRRVDVSSFLGPAFGEELGDDRCDHVADPSLQVGLGGNGRGDGGRTGGRWGVGRTVEGEPQGDRPVACQGPEDRGQLAVTGDGEDLGQSEGGEEVGRDEHLGDLRPGAGQQGQGTVMLGGGGEQLAIAIGQDVELLGREQDRGFADDEPVDLALAPADRAGGPPRRRASGRPPGRSDGRPPRAGRPPVPARLVAARTVISGGQGDPLGQLDPPGGTAARPRPCNRGGEMPRTGERRPARGETCTRARSTRRGDRGGTTRSRGRRGPGTRGRCPCRRQLERPRRPARASPTPFPGYSRRPGRGRRCPPGSSETTSIAPRPCAFRPRAPKNPTRGSSPRKMAAEPGRLVAEVGAVGLGGLQPDGDGRDPDALVEVARRGVDRGVVDGPGFGVLGLHRGVVQGHRLPAVVEHRAARGPRLGRALVMDHHAVGLHHPIVLEGHLLGTPPGVLDDVDCLRRPRCSGCSGPARSSRGSRAHWTPQNVKSSSALVTNSAVGVERHRRRPARRGPRRRGLEVGQRDRQGRRRRVGQDVMIGEQDPRRDQESRPRGAVAPEQLDDGPARGGRRSSGNGKATAWHSRPRSIPESPTSALRGVLVAISAWSMDLGRQTSRGRSRSTRTPVVLGTPASPAARPCRRGMIPPSRQASLRPYRPASSWSVSRVSPRSDRSCCQRLPS